MLCPFSIQASLENSFRGEMPSPPFSLNQGTLPSPRAPVAGTAPVTQSEECIRGIADTQKRSLNGTILLVLYFCTFLSYFP